MGSKLTLVLFLMTASALNPHFQKYEDPSSDIMESIKPSRLKDFKEFLNEEASNYQGGYKIFSLALKYFEFNKPKKLKRIFS